MVLARYVARQLAAPSGLCGRWLLPRVWNQRNSALNDAAFAQLALQPNDRVIEIGFGGGYLLDRMTKVTRAGFVAGVDVSPTIVAFCRRRFRSFSSERLDLRCASSDALPHPDGSFAKACSVNSIFYWPDPRSSLAEISRVLRPGGYLVLCMTCNESLAGKGFARRGLHLLARDEVEALLADAGFEQPDVFPGRDEHRDFLCLRARKPVLAPTRP